MDKLKQYVVLTVVACVAIAAAGWFLLVSPRRAEAAELRAQAAEQVAANARAENELQVLRAQAKELPKEQARLAAVAAKIPDNTALPGLVRALLEAASSTGVELVSITPGEPVLAAPAAPAAAAPPPAPSAQEVPDPATDGTAAPAAPAAPPVGPAGQLASIPVSVDVFGDYFEVQQFLAAVEDLSRAMRVESLTVAPGTSPTAPRSAAASQASSEDGRSLRATVSGFVYMAANRPAPVTATVPEPGAPAAPVAAAESE